uniref:Endonuclease/exonuclease/phosphatase domain-containing protein n=1 Tax=Bracon brevicornis TaxID=1563983 RepID=A0A6V7J8G0_9HYME
MRLHRKERDEELGGGVAIALKNDLKWHPVDLDNEIFNQKNFEVTSVYIQLNNNQKLFCFSISKAPKFNIKKEEWTTLFEQIKLITKDNPTIIGGDLNAKNTIYGSSRTNPSGQNLMRSLAYFDLHVLNNGKHTRYDKASNSTDVMDITLSNGSLAARCTWDVTDWDLNSAHSVISIKINDLYLKGRSHRPGLNTRKTDWEKFQTSLKQTINQGNFMEDNHLILYAKLCEEIIKNVKLNGGKSLNNNSNNNHNNENDEPPRPQTKIRKVFKSWWDEEKCNPLIQKRSDALKKLKQDNSRENMEEYLRILSETQKELKLIKRNHFHNFISSINPRMPLQTVWNNIRKFSGTNTQPKAQNNDKKIGEINKAINKLVKTIPDSYKEPQASQTAGENAINNIWIPITFQELKTIRNNLKKNSAVGPDLISNSIIKNLPDEAITIINHIFNKIMETGKTPEEWKNFDICLIPKPGSDGLRPISLASCMMKTFERAFMNRLEYFLEADLVIPHTQYGFRKGKSCLDNLAIL